MRRMTARNQADCSPHFSRKSNLSHRGASSFSWLLHRHDSRPPTVTIRRRQVKLRHFICCNLRPHDLEMALALKGRITKADDAQYTFGYATPAEHPDFTSAAAADMYRRLTRGTSLRRHLFFSPRL